MIPLRALLISLAAAIIIVNLHGKARGADLPAPCDVIRAYVAVHGRAAALAWAIQQGYSWKQIQSARKCLEEAR